MAEERKIKRWITVHGVHVPIFENDSEDIDQIKSRLIAKQNEYKQQKEIYDRAFTTGSYSGKVHAKAPKNPLKIHSKDSYGRDLASEVIFKNEGRKYIEFDAVNNTTSHYRLNKETGEIQDKKYKRVFKDSWLSI